MHLTESELRAYHDHEPGGPDRARINAHVAACSECRRKIESLAARAGWVNARLASLAPRPAEAPVSVGAARARLSARILEKEQMTMWNTIIPRRYRPAWTAIAAILTLAVALSFAPVRAWAGEFLGLFRVQQIAVVPINPANVPMNFERGSADIERMLTDSMEFESYGEPQKVASAREAGALAGFPVRLPTAIGGKERLTFQPGARATFDVDLTLVRAVLAELGRADVQLPDELDGATITVDLPNSVTAAYGNCVFADNLPEGYDPDDRIRGGCTILMQLPGPTVSAPPNLDVAQVGEAFLQLAGMTAEEAARFSKRIDWATTLVVPIPRYGSTYHEIQVDGVPGTLVQFDLEDHNPEYVLMWVKDGIVYALAGPGRGAAVGLRIANSLE